MSCTTDWLDVALGAVTAAAAAWGVSIARDGLNTWKDQLVGHQEYDVARKTLKAVYVARDAIFGVRRNFISAAEADEAAKAAGIALSAIASPGRDPGVMLAVYGQRFEPVVAAMIELESCLFEAEVIFGPGMKRLFVDLQHQAWVLQRAVDSEVERLGAWERVRREAEELNEAEPRLQLDESDREQRALLYADMKPENDAFRSTVLGLVNEFQVSLQPHLSLKPARIARRR